jgi:hypothetical protein
MSLKDIFFPIAKSFEALEQIDDLERIKRNNYELAERLKEQERLLNEHPIKTFSMDVVSGGVVLPYTLDARGMEYSDCGTYYFYTYKLDERGYRQRVILAHFPIGKTIIKSIEIKK